MSVISLVASLSTLIVGFGFIVGIVTGHVAMRQINESGERGRGMAKAGLIIGYIFGALAILGTIFFLIAIFAISGPGVDAAMLELA